MKQLLRFNNSQTGEPMFTANLEHVPGADLTFEVTMRMDESRLQAPIEQERWLLLGMLAEQIDLILRSHERSAGPPT